MKTFFVAIMLVGASAFAGDGGYTNISCMSTSGRTFLSIFNDNYTGSVQPAAIRLIIDGQMAEYKSSNEVYDQATDTWIPADPTKPQITWDDKGVTVVNSKGVTVLKVALKMAYDNKQYSATIKSGYADPRKGTEFEYYISSNNDISVKCTEYFQGP